MTIKLLSDPISALASILLNNKITRPQQAGRNLWDFNLTK